MRVLGREAHVPLAQPRDPDARVVVARGRRGGERRLAHPHEALFRERIHERPPIGEVAVRRVVRDARRARELPHREIEAPPLREERQRRVEQRAAQVAVVILALRRHVAVDVTRDVDTRHIDLARGSASRQCGQKPHRRRE